ncbi:MAG: putative sterol carrier protein [Verrucomicrobiales bacterium]|jgi:putative sterol carrier protein
MSSMELDEFAAHTARSIASIGEGALPVDVTFTIEQQVSNGEELVGHFHLVLAGGAATIRAGAAAKPDIVIRQDVETARALQDGTMHAQGAFLTGRLSIDGDVHELLNHGPLLAQLMSSSAP